MLLNGEKQEFYFFLVKDTFYTLLFILLSYRFILLHSLDMKIAHSCGKMDAPIQEICIRN